MRILWLILAIFLIVFMCLFEQPPTVLCLLIFADIIFWIASVVPKNE
jgi:hypothetical protein